MKIKSHAKKGGPPPSFVEDLVTYHNSGRIDLFANKAEEAIRRWPASPVGWKARGNLLLMQGMWAEAVEPLARAARLAPNDAQAVHNLGVAYLQLGNRVEAERCFRDAIKRNPDYPQACANLGAVLMDLKRPDEAEGYLRQCVEKAPSFGEGHNNLGNALLELGRPEEAAEAFRKAIACKKGFCEAHSNLGIALTRLGLMQDAEENYRKAIAINAGYAQAHSGLGELLLRVNRPREAVPFYRKAVSLTPRDLDAREGLHAALRQAVPGWHVPMMNDKPRNEAYYQALKAAVTPDTKVLEIGTGSGLLAMMAARLGARQVTTCEAVPEIAKTAQTIVAANGLSDRVVVVPKISTELSVGEDLDERADLLVSEVLSNEFLGEGVLESVEDAKRRLIKPGARIIPARGSIQFALFGGDGMEMNIRVGEVCGFDLSAFNSLVPQKQHIARGDLEVEFLSEAESAFYFDFEKTDRFSDTDSRSMEVTVTKGGRCCGIIQWIRLEMDDSIVFENHPMVPNPASSWQHCVYLLDRPIEVQPGQVCRVTALRNRKVPWLFVDGFS